MLEKIIGIWMSGGWVMIPLLALALMIYSLGLQMLFFLRRGNVQLGRETEWLNWVYDPDQASGRVGEIIRYTQENATASKHVRSGPNALGRS